MFENVNVVAAAVAALLVFLIGGPWYRLFGARWSREAGQDPDRKPKHPAIVFGLAYLCAFAAAIVLAALVGDLTPMYAFHIGAAVGLGIVAASFGINYAFGSRSLVLWLIDAGYNTLLFALMALVIAYWP